MSTPTLGKEPPGSLRGANPQGCFHAPHVVVKASGLSSLVLRHSGQMVSRVCHSWEQRRQKGPLGSPEQAQGTLSPLCGCQ